MGPVTDPFNAGDDDPGEEWFEQMEPAWTATKREALRRFPPGSRVVDGPASDVGEVLIVDDLGDLHIRWPHLGVSIASSPWSGLRVVEDSD